MPLSVQWLSAQISQGLGGFFTLFQIFLMKADIESLKIDLGIALKFFNENPHVREMPFMHSFPKNACERSAALLAVALDRKYKNSRIVLVRGRCMTNGEMHYWFEIDDLAVDPTAHQFAEFGAPFGCQKPSLLEDRFPKKMEFNDPETSTDLPWNSNGRWDTALAALCISINAWKFLRLS